MGDREVVAKSGSRQVLKQPNPKLAGSAVTSRVNDPRMVFDRLKGGGDKPCKNVRGEVAKPFNAKDHSTTSELVTAVHNGDAKTLRKILDPEATKDLSDAELISAVRHALPHQILSKLLYDPSLSHSEKTFYLNFVSNEMKAMDGKAQESLQKTYSDAVSRNGYSPVDITNNQLQLHPNQPVSFDSPSVKNTFQDSSLALKNSFSAEPVIPFDPIIKTEQFTHNIADNLIAESEKRLKIKGPQTKTWKDSSFNEVPGSPYSDYVKPVKSGDAIPDSIYDTTPILTLGSVKITDDFIKSPVSPKIGRTAKPAVRPSKTEPVIRVLHHAVLFGRDTTSKSIPAKPNKKSVVSVKYKLTDLNSVMASKLPVLRAHKKTGKKQKPVKPSKNPMSLLFPKTRGKRQKAKQNQPANGLKLPVKFRKSSLRQSKSGKRAPPPVLSGKSARRLPKTRNSGIAVKPVVKKPIKRAKSKNSILQSSSSSRTKKSHEKIRLNHKNADIFGKIVSKRFQTSSQSKKPRQSSKKKKKTPLSIILPSWFWKRKKKKRKK